MSANWFRWKFLTTLYIQQKLGQLAFEMQTGAVGFSQAHQQDSPERTMILDLQILNMSANWFQCQITLACKKNGSGCIFRQVQAASIDSEEDDVQGCCSQRGTFPWGAKAQQGEAWGGVLYECRRWGVELSDQLEPVVKSSLAFASSCIAGRSLGSGRGF